MADVPAVENKTKIGVRADMTIDDEPVAIEGLLGGDFFLQLNKPATLGTPISFAYWLKDTYKVQNLDIMLPTKYQNSKSFKDAFKDYKSQKNSKKRASFEKIITDHFVEKGIPPQLHNIILSAFLAELTVMDLLIDIKAEDKEKNTLKTTKMLFGLSVGFNKPLELLLNIDVNKLSIMIMNAPTSDFTFPERVELPRSTPLPIEPARATGFIVFPENPGGNGTITLGTDVWTFVDTAPADRQVRRSDSLDGTLTSLAATLNKAPSGDTAKCTYRANLDENQLDVIFKAVGVAGNDFAIAADDTSKGQVSNPTLRGGIGEVKKSAEKFARGEIVFSANPDDGSKITLNGIVWKFVTSDPKDNVSESKIGTDAAETVDLLATRLSNSDDPEIKECGYEADHERLVITYKAPGATGDSFTLAADTNSKGKVSGPTLTDGA